MLNKLTAKQELIQNIEKRLTDKDKLIVKELFNNGISDVHKPIFPNFLRSSPEMEIVLACRMQQYIDGKLRGMVSSLLEKEVIVEAIPTEDCVKYQTVLIKYDGNSYTVTHEQYQDNHHPVINSLAEGEQDAIFGAIYEFKESQNGGTTN